MLENFQLLTKSYADIVVYNTTRPKKFGIADSISWLSE